MLASATDRPVLVVAHSDVLSWWQAVHKHVATSRMGPISRTRCRRAGRGHPHRRADRSGAARSRAPLRAARTQCRGDPQRDRARRLCAIAETRRSCWLPAGFGMPRRTSRYSRRSRPILPGRSRSLETSNIPRAAPRGTRMFGLLGRLSPAEMARRLGRASIFVAPARYEPFGFAILEAAAAGCALVLGDIPSLRENWDGAAVFVDPEDRSALKSAINALIANPRERSRVAAAVQCRARRIHAASYGASLRGALPRDDAELRPAWRPRNAEARLVLPLAPLRLESRQCAFPARRFERMLASRFRRAGVGADATAGAPQNLAQDHGPAALDAWREAYPPLPLAVYDPARLDLDRVLDGADLVLVHEWNEPELVARIAAHRKSGGSYLLLFHDTHHRMVSAPEAIGATGSRRFRRRARLRRSPARSLSPPRLGTPSVHLARGRRSPRVSARGRKSPRQRDLVWIGNWGDDERTAELQEFLIEPVHVTRALGARARRALPSCGARDARREPVSNSPAICRISGFPSALPRPRQRSTYRAAPMSACCRASRRSACSRRWPAAFRWSRRLGRTARGCSRPARTFWSPATAPRCAVISTRSAHDPDWAETLARHGRATIEAATAAPIGSTSCSSICRALGRDLCPPQAVAAQ